ncbi:MAG TPA: hypothetical protein VFE04_04825 [Puia sp.]|jgi:hypothetical protein|nr:hypothetical protein [Puia sp.]
MTEWIPAACGSIFALMCVLKNDQEEKQLSSCPSSDIEFAKID